MVLSTVAEVARRASRYSAYGAALVLTACVALTMVDILLRNLVNSAVPGIVELTQLAIMWCAFMSIPIGFVRDDHISVDLLSDRLPARAQRWLASIIALIASLFLAVATAWSWDQLVMAHQQKDSSPTIGIPMLWYWIPVVFGFALSALCAATQRIRAGADAASEAQGARP